MLIFKIKENYVNYFIYRVPIEKWARYEYEECRGHLPKWSTSSMILDIFSLN